uniref:Decapping mRNA 1B n=1 Tax=Neogobius melanostomus TaxID=47308 RepID=A0A8C6UMK4_9GOBI
MLSKARTEYDKDKSTSEPKEIGGSSVLYGNPNLIKPIPVKPSTRENEGRLSLATLFGTQQKHPSPQPAPGSSSVSNFGTITRPPVARTLTYESTKTSGQSDSPRDASREAGAQQQQSQSQHCPAIQKLMQGQQRGVLQTVSESPENRLCDNGVQIDLQPVYHHQPQPHHLHHHHQHPMHHRQQHIQPDPIKRLFQSQPPACSAAPPCCGVNLQQNQTVPAQPVPVSHHQPQPNQPLMFNRPPGEIHQHNCHLVTAAPLTVFPGQIPGVVSPHELLQKLQIVQQQQQQGLTPGDSPQLGPALAPRFMPPPQTDARETSHNQIPNQPSTTAALQFQVISPQRIPATVAPAMLLSPSVFTQTKPSTGLAPAQDTRPGPSNPVQILSRSQLQATLLHLIQNDCSFLDCIYEAYTSRFSSDPRCKY